ncbi:MAG: GNAT family N-acetyltransferase [Anaerolineaceae bacterium]
MSEISIRQIQGKEMIDTLYGLASYAFHPTQPLLKKDEWQKWIVERPESSCFVLYEDGSPLSCAASTAMIQNVRGKIYDQAGVWGVATSPLARWKGYCRQVLTSLFAASYESGATFSCLYPFKESFYENLGYSTFHMSQLARFKPEALMPLLKKDLGGEIQFMSIQDGFDDYQKFLREYLLRVHGMTVTRQIDPSKGIMNKAWMVKAMANGRVEGLMQYQIQGSEQDQGKFQFCALCFYYLSSQAKYLLLQWIARHVDQADRVLLVLSPNEQPNTWLSGLRVKTESYEAPMGRVISVANLGGMQVGEGSFTTKIRDPFCPWNEGLWHFSSENGLLKVNRAENADCEMNIQALTALVYGTHDVDDFSWRGWATIPDHLHDTVKQMFSRQTPFLDEEF